MWWNLLHNIIKTVNYATENRQGLVRCNDSSGQITPPSELCQYESTIHCQVMSRWIQPGQKTLLRYSKIWYILFGRNIKCYFVSPITFPINARANLLPLVLGVLESVEIEIFISHDMTINCGERSEFLPSDHVAICLYVCMSWTQRRLATRHSTSLKINEYYYRVNTFVLTQQVFYVSWALFTLFRVIFSGEINTTAICTS